MKNRLQFFRFSFVEFIALRDILNTTDTMRQVLEKLGLLRQPGEMKVGRAWTKHRIYDHSYRAISKTCFAVTVGLSAWMAYKFIHYRLCKFFIDNMLKAIFFIQLPVMKIRSHVEFFSPSF